MLNTAASFDSAAILCERGLAKREGLIWFLRHVTTDGTGSLLEDTDTRAMLILRHDEGIIRDAFNARYSAIDLMDHRTQQTQIGLRSRFLALLYRLYVAGRKQTPAELRRQLQINEVQLAIASLQRLALMGNPRFDELAEHCERSAAADDDLLAHVMDPFQLRYVLSYHQASTHFSLGADNVAALITACRHRDQTAVRAIVDQLTVDLDALPKDTPQLLRGVLLEVWRKGDGDLGMLAFCIAVLDTQMFEDLGWESSRAFFVQLRRITGPGSEVLDGFLTDEDIDDALQIAEELRQSELIAHFRKLATAYDTKLRRNVRRSVFVTASHRRPSIPIVESVDSRPPMSAAPFRPAVVGAR